MTDDMVSHQRYGVDNVWEIVEATYPNRTFYQILAHGWLIADCYNGPDGWRLSSRPSQRIPTHVLEELPKGASEVLALSGRGSS